MDGDCPRHGGGCPVLAAPGQVAALPGVVLLLHQVVAGAEGHQVGVVGRGGDGDTASAPDIGVAQLVRKVLKNIRSVTVVVVKHVVVSRSRCSLEETLKNGI